MLFCRRPKDGELFAVELVDAVKLSSKPAAAYQGITGALGGREELDEVTLDPPLLRTEDPLRL